MRHAIDRLRCTAGRAGRPGRDCRNAHARPGCQVSRRPRRGRWLGPAAGPVALTILATGCGAHPPAAPEQPGVITVVAAENFWGSLVSQLGGSHVRVRSILTNPNPDPP